MLTECLSLNMLIRSTCHLSIVYYSDCHDNGC